MVSTSAAMRLDDLARSAPSSQAARLIEAARDLGPTITAMRDEIERELRLPRAPERVPRHASSAAPARDARGSDLPEAGGKGAGIHQLIDAANAVVMLAFEHGFAGA